MDTQHTPALNRLGMALLECCLHSVGGYVLVRKGIRTDRRTRVSTTYWRVNVRCPGAKTITASGQRLIDALQRAAQRVEVRP